jgi:hypothetical protein
MSVISSLLRLILDKVDKVNHWTMSSGVSRVSTHRFVTLPATSGGEPATADFDAFRGGAREDVS